MSDVEFNHIERDAMDAIWRRARVMRPQLDRLSLEMDLAAANGANGNPPLDAARLAVADRATFAHDVFGIVQCMDRATGRLGRCFLPRTARPVEEIDA